jgi:large subunit ribosomal protein L17
MAMYRNLVTDLLQYEKIVTTEAKAKEVRGMAEKIITLGKNGGLHARRQVLAFVTDKKAVAGLFDEIAPRYAERPGGYTRLVKLGPRLGDGAPMARLELVE